MHPQIIQLAILAAAFYLPLLALVAVYLFRKLQLQERMRNIEHGVESTVDAAAIAARTRRTGIVCIAGALGLSMADVILVVGSGNLQALVFQAVAIVPLAIGLGLLVDYRLARRDLREQGRP
jgi:hypothetical protein